MPRNNKRKKRGKSRVVRVPRTIVSNKVHAFKRSTFERRVDTIPVGPGYLSYGLSFTLGDIDDVSEFTNLYDQYKLNAVKITFYQHGTNSETSTSSATPMLMWHADHDDATYHPSVSDMTTDSRMKSRQFLGKNTIFIKPKVQNDNNNSQVISPKNNPWVDMNDTAVKYYGLKYMLLGPTGANTVVTFDIVKTYYFMCKTPR